MGLGSWKEKVLHYFWHGFQVSLKQQKANRRQTCGRLPSCHNLFNNHSDKKEMKWHGIKCSAQDPTSQWQTEDRHVDNYQAVTTLVNNHFDKKEMKWHGIKCRAQDPTCHWGTFNELNIFRSALRCDSSCFSICLPCLSTVIGRLEGFYNFCELFCGFLLIFLSFLGYCSVANRKGYKHA